MMENKIPEKVYKYRDWSNGFHKNILLHNELYLPSPKEFNDPFDCRIPVNFINQTLEERDQYINYLAINQYQNAENKGLDLGFYIKKLEKALEEDIVSFQGELERFYFTQLDNNYGVLSLSTKWNGILLWSHYANQHKGFCIGFWEEKLRAFGFFVRTGIVEYPEEFPNIKPTVEKTKEDRLNRIQMQTTTKSKDWEYEKEYRFIKYLQEPKPFERLLTVPNEVISEVVLGINISSDDKDEIVEICRRKNIPVYQARKVPFKFAIDRELIE